MPPPALTLLSDHVTDPFDGTRVVVVVVLAVTAPESTLRTSSDAPPRLSDDARYVAETEAVDCLARNETPRYTTDDVRVYAADWLAPSEPAEAVYVNVLPERLGLISTPLVRLLVIVSVVLGSAVPSDAVIEPDAV